MDKRILAAIAPRFATVDEMQRFCLSDDRCYFFHAALHSPGLLVLTVYHAEIAKRNEARPYLTVYFSKTDFINTMFVEKENQYRWFTSCLRRYFPYHCAKSLMDAGSKQAIADFFGSEDDFFKVIERFQDGVLAARLARKHKAITDAIDADMALVPALPKRFEEYIGTKAMSQRYIFYDYAKRKVLAGFCTNCRQDVVVEMPRHNKEGVCPSCNATVACKARGKLKNAIWDRVNITLPQKVKGGFVLRFFETWRREHTNGERKVGYYEYRRFLYLDGDIHHYIWGDFKHTGRMRWCHCTDNLHPYDGWLYPGNLSKMMASTTWQYSSPHLYMESSPKPCLSWYLRCYLKSPFLENLLKNGFTRIANNYLVRDRFDVDIDAGKTRIHELLRLSRRGLRIVQEPHMEPHHLSAAQKLETIGYMNYDATLLHKICDAWKTDTDRFIKHVLPYATFMKAMRYVAKLDQQKRQDWLDYMKMAADLGYDMRKTHAIFPRNLKKAHDTITWLHREKAALASEDEFAPHVRRLQSYEWKEKDAPYIVVAPQKAKDIVDEGHRLNHCVHDYISRVIAGTCAILFLRNAAKPNKPYVTLEIRGNRVRQYRAVNNDPPDEATNAFMKEYEQWLGGRKPAPAAA